jgi:hypothetical protein
LTGQIRRALADDATPGTADRSPGMLDEAETRALMRHLVPVIG